MINYDRDRFGDDMCKGAFRGSSDLMDCLHVVFFSPFFFVVFFIVFLASTGSNGGMKNATKNARNGFRTHSVRKTLRY